ncbi:MAG: hypothetical protein ABJ360_19460 [Roseobacter sp.]
MPRGSHEVTIIGLRGQERQLASWGGKIAFCMGRSCRNIIDFELWIAFLASKIVGDALYPTRVTIDITLDRQSAADHRPQIPRPSPSGGKVRYWEWFHRVL